MLSRSSIARLALCLGTSFFRGSSQADCLFDDESWRTAAPLEYDLSSSAERKAPGSITDTAVLYPNNMGANGCPVESQFETAVITVPDFITSSAYSGVTVELEDYNNYVGCGSLNADQIWCLKLQWSNKFAGPPGYDEPILVVLLLRDKDSKRVYRSQQIFIGKTGGPNISVTKLADAQTDLCDVVASTFLGEVDYAPTDDADMDDFSFDALPNIVPNIVDSSYALDAFAASSADISDLITDGSSVGLATCSDTDYLGGITATYDDYSVWFEESSGSWTETTPGGCITVQQNTAAAPTLRLQTDASCPASFTVQYKLCKGPIVSLVPDTCSAPAMINYFECSLVTLQAGATKLIQNVANPSPDPTVDGSTDTFAFPLWSTETGDALKFEVMVVENTCGNIVYSPSISSIDTFDFYHVTFVEATKMFTFDLSAKTSQYPHLLQLSITVNIPGTSEVLSMVIYVLEKEPCTPDSPKLDTYNDDDATLVAWPDGTAISMPLRAIISSSFVWEVTYADPACILDFYQVTITDPDGLSLVQTFDVVTRLPTTVVSEDPLTTSGIFQLYDTSTELRPDRVELQLNTALLIDADLSKYVGTYTITVEWAIDGVLDTTSTPSQYDLTYELTVDCLQGDLLNLNSVDAFQTVTDSTTIAEQIVHTSLFPGESLKILTDDNGSIDPDLFGLLPGVEYYEDLCGPITIEVTAPETGFWTVTDNQLTLQSTSTGWPSLPLHEMTINFTFKIFYSSHAALVNDPLNTLLFKTAVFPVTVYDCSSRFDATQDNPFFVYTDYFTAYPYSMTLIPHDDIPAYCIDTLGVHLDVINSFAFISQSATDPLTFELSAPPTDPIADFYFSGTVQKEYPPDAVRVDDTIIFELNVCKIIEPSPTYDSSVHYYDKSDPSVADQVINLAPYATNNPTNCGGIDYFITSVIHDADGAFDIAQVSHDAVTDPSAPTLTFASASSYTVGTITVEISVHSDTYDTTGVDPILSQNVILTIIDCLQEGATMTTAGNIATQVIEKHFGAADFDGVIAMTATPAPSYTAETYLFTNLVDQSWCPISFLKITCTDPSSATYTVNGDGSTAVGTSTLCPTFDYNMDLTSQDRGISLESAAFPTDTTGKAVYIGTYTFQVEALSAQSASFVGSPWTFQVVLKADCSTVQIIVTPTDQTYQIDPPAFYNEGTSYTLTDEIHYWWRSSPSPFTITGFAIPNSDSCAIGYRLKQIKPDNINIIRFGLDVAPNNIYRVKTGLTEANVVTLETSSGSTPQLKIESVTNIKMVYVAKQYFVQAFLCNSGIDPCTDQDMILATLEELPVTITFFADCSNANDELILQSATVLQDFSIYIGVTGPGNNWQEPLTTSWLPVAFKDSTTNDAIMFVDDNAVSYCSSFTVDNYTNAVTQSDLFLESSSTDELQFLSDITNMHVKNTDGCDLEDFANHPILCQITYNVYVTIDLTLDKTLYGPDVTLFPDTLERVATVASGTITYISECMSLGTWLTGLNNDYWHLSQADPTNFDLPLRYGYEVSYLEIAATFDFPYVQPVLATESDLITTCGNIVYTITPSFTTSSALQLALTNMEFLTSTVYEQPSPAYTMTATDLYTLGSITVATKDQNLALDILNRLAPYSTDYTWTLTAQMEETDYASLFTFDFATSGHPAITLTMYDHCYAMTFDGPLDDVDPIDQEPDGVQLEIESGHAGHNPVYVKNGNNYQDWAYSITKHLKTVDSSFYIYPLNYTRALAPLNADGLNPNFAPYQPNEGCDHLSYTLESQTWSWVGESLISIPSSENKWQSFAQEAFQLGHNSVKYRYSTANPNVEIRDAQFVTFYVEILDCRVEKFTSPNQTYFQDVVMKLGESVEFTFNNFIISPECEFNITYTVTLMENTNENDEHIIYKASLDGQTPEEDFVVMENISEDPSLYDYIVKINPTSGNLQGRTWSVYIRGEIWTNSTLQENMYAQTLPFHLTVEQNVYVLPNDPPIVQNWQPEVKVMAGLEKNYQIGMPFDMQLDEFFVEEWNFVGLSEVDIPPWVEFRNTTDINEGIFFWMSPSEEDIGFSTEINFKLTDTNPNQMSKEYTFRITVVAADATYITTIEEEEVKKRPEIIFVVVEKPNIEGFFNVKFSKYIKLRRNCTEWSDTNEGDDRIKMKYIPSLETKDYMYDLDVEIEMGWKVIEASVKDRDPVYSRPAKTLEEEEPIQGRRRLQEIAASNQEVPTDPDSSGGPVNTTTEEEDFPDGMIETNRLMVQLDFTYIELVSKNAEDRIEVEIAEELFAEELVGQNLSFIQDNKQDYFFEYNIPRFQDKEMVELVEFVEALTKGTENMLQAFFGANFLVSLFSAGILQYLWGMINTLQIIVLTALFNLETPLNANMIMIMILKLCGLEFVSTDDIYGAVFDFRETEAFFTVVTADGQKISKWEESGFESAVFIELLGPIFVIPFAFAGLILAKKLIAKVFACCKDNFLMRHILQKTDILLVTIRFMLESCIELGLCSMISILMYEKKVFDNGWEILSYGLSCCCILALLIVPMRLYKLINLYLKSISEVDKKDQEEVAKENRYHSLFEQFRPNRPSLRYAILFFTRRYLIIFILTVLPGLKYVQIIGQVWSTIGIISYMSIVRPFNSPLGNRQELMNEGFVLIACYPLYTFTPWVWSEARTLEAGWVLVACILLIVLINIAILTAIIASQMYYKVRKAILRKRIRQRQAELMQKRLNEAVKLKAAKEKREQDLYAMFKYTAENCHDNSAKIEIKAKTKDLEKKSSAIDASGKLEAVVSRNAPIQTQLQSKTTVSKLTKMKQDGVSEKPDQLVSFSLDDPYLFMKSDDDWKSDRDGGEPKMSYRAKHNTFVKPPESPTHEIDQLLAVDKWGEAQKIVHKHYGITLSKYRKMRDENDVVSGPNMMGAVRKKQPDLIMVVQQDVMMGVHPHERIGVNKVKQQFDSQLIKPSRPPQNDQVSKAWGQPQIGACLEERVDPKPMKTTGKKKKKAKAKAKYSKNKRVGNNFVVVEVSKEEEERQQRAKQLDARIQLGTKLTYEDVRMVRAGATFEEKFNISIKLVTNQMQGIMH